jgi:hypothetical protein
MKIKKNKARFPFISQLRAEIFRCGIRLLSFVPRDRDSVRLYLLMKSAAGKLADFPYESHRTRGCGSQPVRLFPIFAFLLPPLLMDMVNLSAICSEVVNSNINLIFKWRFEKDARTSLTRRHSHFRPSNTGLS